jgi:hypothetical protein
MRIVLLLGALVLGLAGLPGCSDKPSTGGQTIVGTAAPDAPIGPNAPNKEGKGRIPKKL